MQLTPELSTIALENVAARMALILDEPHFQTQPPCSARSQCCTTEQILANDLASAAVSTAPVHAQEPSPITTPGAVTVATSLPHSFWIPRRSTRRRLAGHLVGSRHCRYFRPVRSHRDRDRRQSIPHELALAGLRDRRDRLRGTRHAGNPRVPGRTVGGAQRDRHGACRACGRPWRYWLARWDG